MALHRKINALVELRPDVAVIQECAHPDRLLEKAPCAPIRSYVWVGGEGHGRNKGLAIITFGEWRASPLPTNENLRWILPVNIHGPGSFALLGVWAQHQSYPMRKHEIGPLLRALDIHAHLLSEQDVIVAGDFNNNPFWDRPGYANNHLNAVKKLSAAGLVSAYHRRFGCEHGQELHPTIHWCTRQATERLYHIDYTFLPEDWWVSVREVYLGSYRDWVERRDGHPSLSDHVPMVVELDDEVLGG